MAELANLYTRGPDQYPTTMADTYRYLVDYQTITSTIKTSSDEAEIAYHTYDNRSDRGRAGRGRGGGQGRGTGRGRGSGRSQGGRGLSCNANQGGQNKTNLAEADEDNDPDNQ
eukprot:14899039-Ditylum_brightwellii.AAC.1